MARRKQQYNIRNEAGHLWQVTAQGPRSAAVAFAAKFKCKYKRWPPLGYQMRIVPRDTPELEPDVKYVTAAVIDQAAELLLSEREF